MNLLLVGGLDHFLFLHVLGMSSSQLTNIFQRDGPGPPTRLHLLADLSLLNMLRLLVLCNADRLRVVVGVGGVGLPCDIISQVDIEYPIPSVFCHYVTFEFEGPNPLGNTQFLDCVGRSW